jgi:hypothetical protein
MHNLQQDGKTVVKLEIWVDPNNINNWQKVYDFIDSGGLGSDGGKCGGAPDQIITWGGRMQYLDGITQTVYQSRI